MLKKLLIAAAILATSSTIAFANGPYLGASLGVNNTKFDGKNADGDNTFSLGSRGALLNVFGGYGATVNQNIYLGGELFAGATNANAKVKDSDGTANLRTKYSFGISFIPGYMLTDHTMLYGRVGLVKTRFEAKDTSAGTTTTDRKTLTGGQVGLGMQTSLTQNVDLRGEYVYTGYRSAKMLGDKMTPSTDQFNLGVVYKFD
jgi:outer membrane immunogenic protein